jgi:hypothetical protein
MTTVYIPWLLNSLTGTASSRSKYKEIRPKLYTNTMEADATPDPPIPYHAVRFAVRENLPSVLEATKTLDDAINSIRTKLNTLHNIVNKPANDAGNQEMMDAVEGLLKDTLEVKEWSKVWHEKLNVACVMIKLVYPQQ